MNWIKLRLIPHGSKDWERFDLNADHIVFARDNHECGSDLLLSTGLLIHVKETGPELDGLINKAP